MFKKKKTENEVKVKKYKKRKNGQRLNVKNLQIKDVLKIDRKACKIELIEKYINSEMIK